MYENEPVARAESDILLPSGISAAAIDRVYREVTDTKWTVFEYEESALLTDALKDLKKRIRGVTMRETEGSENAATRVVMGFLFAHRLVRQSNPSFMPSVAGFQEVFERVKVFGTEKKQGADGKEISYFPTLQDAFAENPAAFDHLLNKFSNEDARWGAQVLLLAAIDQVMVAPKS